MLWTGSRIVNPVRQTWCPSYSVYFFLYVELSFQTLITLPNVTEKMPCMAFRLGNKQEILRQTVSTSLADEPAGAG